MRLEDDFYVCIKGVSEETYHKVCQKLIRDGANTGEYRIKHNSFKNFNYVGLEFGGVYHVADLFVGEFEVSAETFLSKSLDELSLQKYNSAKNSGMFWEFFPEATGGINQDLQAVRVNIHTTKDENGKTKVQHFYDIIDEDLDIELFTSDA